MTNSSNAKLILCCFCLCLCAAFMPLTFGEEFAECENVADGSYVASSQSCQTYILCSGADSAAGECDDGEYFDVEQGYCDAKENVYCALDAVDEPEDEPELEAEEEPEELEGNEIETPSEEEEPTIITETTAAAPTELGSTTMATWTAPIVVKASCPDSDDPSQVTLLANSESCSEYYLCYHGHAIEMRCANQLHFNVNTGLCDHPENVQCALNRPNANKCLPHITDFFPHPQKCNYYYYCIKGYLTVQQCPFYYGWDIERRSCVQITQAKCFGASKRI